MFCPECGTRARAGQKFCAECGFDLRSFERDEDAGTEVVQPDAGDDGYVDRDAERHEHDPDGDDDEYDDDGGYEDGQDDHGGGYDDDHATADRPPVRTDDEPPGHGGDVVTRRLDAPVDPMLARPAGTSSPARDRMWSVTGQHTPVPAGPAGHDPDATLRLPAAPIGARPDEAPTRVNQPRVEHDRTAVYGVPYPTAEQPAVASGDWGWDRDDAAAYRPARSVRFRTVVLPAVVAVAAGALAVSRILIEIVPSAAAPGMAVGTWMVNDLGTNNTVAAILAMVAAFLGALLWCFGFRWGAGLAGGGGLALAGWAALLVGLAEWQIASAEQRASDLGIGLTITRDVGYWGLIAAAAAGVLTFFASLTGSGRDRQGGLDPWIAALGAASVLVAAGGPLIPLGTADITGNVSSATLVADLPDLFFVGRLVQLGLLAFAGIIGFLLVRRYGLGLAIGGATVAGFQLVTAATGQTESPIGPGYANPGSIADLSPHGVTVVGMGLAGFFALVAVVMAALDRGDRV